MLPLRPPSFFFKVGEKCSYTQGELELLDNLTCSNVDDENPRSICLGTSRKNILKINRNRNATSSKSLPYRPLLKPS